MVACRNIKLRNVQPIVLDGGHMWHMLLVYVEALWAVVTFKVETVSEDIWWWHMDMYKLVTVIIYSRSHYKKVAS